MIIVSFGENGKRRVLALISVSSGGDDTMPPVRINVGIKNDGTNNRAGIQDEIDAILFHAISPLPTMEHAQWSEIAAHPSKVCWRMHL
jgi:hypothetical protein